MQGENNVESSSPAAESSSDDAEESTAVIETDTPSEAPEELSTVTVTGRDANGEDIQVEVPYKPERMVVLDLANLDILDNLGLGGCIVGASTITLPYLQSYNDDLPPPTWRPLWPVSPT